SPPCESSSRHEVNRQAPNYRKKPTQMSGLFFYKRSKAAATIIEKPNLSIGIYLLGLQDRQVTSHPRSNVHGSLLAAGSSLSACHWPPSFAALIEHHAAEIFFFKR
ncbi:hypothetical protein, partial [Aestuariibacter sp. A3R04]|uniref:hypothetical protein n=1 Tax=Aestuariibacter sp. A3R04 TaxID=2841571 RepID=UPI001C08BC70